MKRQTSINQAFFNSKRKNQKDCKPYAGFKGNDKRPSFKFTFKGAGIIKLNYLKGQFYSSFPLGGRTVTVAALNNGNIVYAQVRIP
jgi:hypothetical protein